MLAKHGAAVLDLDQVGAAVSFTPHVTTFDS